MVAFAAVTLRTSAMQFFNSMYVRRGLLGSPVRQNMVPRRKHGAGMRHAVSVPQTVPVVCVPIYCMVIQRAAWRCMSSHRGLRHLILLLAGAACCNTRRANFATARKKKRVVCGCGMQREH